MARILWLGDAGCYTGFGRVTHSIGERLVERGHDVHVLAYNHRGDHWPTNLKLYVPTLQVPKDTYGTSRHLELLLKIEPEVIVMLNDPQVLIQLLLKNGYDPEKMMARFAPIICYIPIDGYNRPPHWDVLKTFTRRVAMAKFGHEAMEGSDYVPHGVDTEQFWPVSGQQPVTLSTGQVLKSKKDAKEAFGIPRDSFLVMRVDTNTGRKDFPATWKALLPVMKRHPDMYAWFHTKGTQDIAAVDLQALFSREPDIADRFRLPDFSNSRGWPQQDLNGLLNAADIFVSTSRGEGFGLTIAEALACGVPVIAQNISSIPEVVGPGGVLIEPKYPITVPSGEDQWLADVEKFSEAIEHLYQSRGARRELGAKGREHVVKSFSWDFAADRFHEFVEEERTRALAARTGTSEVTPDAES